MAAAAADEAAFAALGRVHVGTADDLNTAGDARGRMLQPVLTQVHLEGDVVEAPASLLRLDPRRFDDFAELHIPSFCNCANLLASRR